MATTPLPRDFNEFLRLLNEKKVENLINLDHLKQNELAAGRNKDLADLENLPWSHSCSRRRHGFPVLQMNVHIERDRQEAFTDNNRGVIPPMQQKSTWEEFFDNHAPIYEQNVFTKNTIREVDFLLDELKLAAGASILDVGCGTGRHSIELARRGYAVTGVDLSAGMLAQAAEAAQKAGVQVEWVHSDATRFSSSRKFDAVICLCEGAFGLLGGGDDPIAHPSAVLRNVCRALKLHAKAVFTVLNGYAMARRYSTKDVEACRFDPLGLVEASEFSPREALPEIPLRERAFVPTELTLLFGLAGLRVLNMWGGTAGNWGRRPIDLDEMEIMIVAQKDGESVTAEDLH